MSFQLLDKNKFKYQNTSCVFTLSWTLLIHTIIC